MGLRLPQLRVVPLPLPSGSGPLPALRVSTPSSALGGALPVLPHRRAPPHSDGAGKGRGLTVFCLHRAQGTRVLVHCKMGVSRSAATVIAYAMKQYGWSLEQALRHVQELRPIARPNPGFLRQLQTYQGILTARYKPGGRGAGGCGRWAWLLGHSKLTEAHLFPAGRATSGSRKWVGLPQRSPSPRRCLHHSHLFRRNQGAVGR